MSAVGLGRLRFSWTRNWGESVSEKSEPAMSEKQSVEVAPEPTRMRCSAIRKQEGTRVAAAARQARGDPPARARGGDIPPAGMDAGLKERHNDPLETKLNEATRRIGEPADREREVHRPLGRRTSTRSRSAAVSRPRSGPPWPFTSSTSTASGASHRALPSLPSPNEGYETQRCLTVCLSPWKPRSIALLVPRGADKCSKSRSDHRQGSACRSH